MRKLTNKKGFTIVELVIVIAVIAILAAVLIPTFNSVIKKANESAALQECKAALDVVTLAEDGNLDGKAFFFITAKGACFVYDATSGDICGDNVANKELVAYKNGTEYYKVVKVGDDSKINDITVTEMTATTGGYNADIRGDLGSTKVYKYTVPTT